MRKIKVLLCAAALMLTLSGCGEITDAQSAWEQAKSELQDELGGAKEEIGHALDELSGAKDDLGSALNEIGGGFGKNEEQTDQNMAQLNKACQELYSGLCSGAIHAQTEQAIRAELSAELPAADDDPAVRVQKAMKFTVSDAAAYAGIKGINYDQLYFVDNSFGEYEHGDIIAKTDSAVVGYEDQVCQLKGTTTFGRLYANP